MSRHVHDDDRRELEAALERHIGAGPTGTLMALLPPVDWSEIARQSDLVAVRDDLVAVRDDVAVLKTDVAELKTDVGVLKTDVADLKTDVGVLKTDVAGLKTDVVGLRSDFGQLRSDMKNDQVTMRAENTEFRSLVRDDIGRLRVEMLTQFNALWFRMFFTVIGGMLGLGGIVIAASQLA